MDVIELTERLIEINSVTGSEHEIAQFIASQLDFMDVEFQEIDGFGPNVLAKNIPNPELFTKAIVYVFGKGDALILNKQINISISK